MPLWQEFVGGFYKALSPVIAADTAVNLYTETRAIPGSAKQVTIYGTPGLSSVLSVDPQGCRGLFTQDGRTFAVYANTLYEIDFVNAVATERGIVPDDGAPVSFASNGQGGDQLGLVSGGSLLVLDLATNDLETVTLPFSDPVMIAFIDGYGLINQADTPIVWFSALEDLTSWDALDFFTRSGTSDNIVGIGVSRDRVLALGTQTSTWYYNSGDADTPFLPYPGTTMQVGLAAPWLMAVYSDVFYWVAQWPTGQRQVVRASEPSAQAVSTPPIDRFLAACTTLDDAELTIYEQEGHPFVCLTAPSSPDAIQTYCFDVRESLWHARAGWDDVLGVFTRWRVRGMTQANGAVYAGDYATGDLYEVDLDTYDEDGDILRRERTAPYLGSNNQWVFLDAFELGTQPGVGLSSGQGSAPLVTLEISRDSARTWVNAGDRSLGARGDYDARTIWNRLGRVRQDRLVIRVTQTDPVKTVWGPGAWLRFTSGTQQL